MHKRIKKRKTNKSSDITNLKKKRKRKKKEIKNTSGTSLVAQWLGIRLPMQGTRVRALVPEDPTCCSVIKPMHHNY